MSVFIHKDRAVQKILECFHNTDIFADASLKYNRGGDFLAFSHIIEIVGSNCTADACNDIFPWVPHLNLVHEV